ncbi:VPLPA-CTERM sorting domain-containing protein [Inhella proteolytica]|uniref:VPLPA-CTERM sorting domain-containing protein n=1 Tax=Inhella proteolytica TaxID=2795029 RepID=A0A931J468_9BURK|nr:VPLPA-CTERM sorting domain-containing protein [Inhella proteolytica]MBH9577214.1 VPLPA-CTERM sorting domain-containing protein [Inhella proteolytica]
MNICKQLAGLALGCASLAPLAAPVTLDLTSGLDSNVAVANPSLRDTYDEDGFRLQMAQAGNHFDRGFIGDLGFHNGPTNLDDIGWTLSFGGAAFDLLGVDIAAFANEARSMTLRGSNGQTLTLDQNGFQALAFHNVTAVHFNIDQDGGIQTVGLNGLLIDTVPTLAVPEPASALLMLAGLGGLAALRRRRG